MKWTICAALALALTAGTAWGDTTWLQFTGTSTMGSGHVSSIWSVGTQGWSTQANSNTGGDWNNPAGPVPGDFFVSLMNDDWYFPITLFKYDLPAAMNGAIINSAQFSYKPTWWNGGQWENVEIRPINSPVDWALGDGTHDNRWGEDNGVGWYYADFNKTGTVYNAGRGIDVTGVGTTWTGAQMDRYQVMSDRLAPAIDTIFGGVVSTGTATMGLSTFDMTAYMAGLVNGGTKNQGFALSTMNAVYSGTTASGGLCEQYTTNFDWGPGAHGGLYIDYTPVVPGDANKDGITDFKDYVVWFSNFNNTSSPTWSMGDFNLDSIVDFKDYVIWFSNFNVTGAYGSSLSSASLGSGPDSAVPEPMTLGLLALALPFIHRRRRAVGSG